MKKLLESMSSPRRNTRDLSQNILVTLIMASVFTAINPNFIDKYNLISIGQNLAPYAMLALGVLMPISMGKTDLSTGSVCIGAAVAGGTLLTMGLPLFACIPVMILFGGLVGFVNGYLVAKKDLQPFIVTLGTMMFVRGITAIFANAPNVMFPTNTWYNSLFSTWMGFPTSFVWIILFTGLLYFVYRKTKVGRYLVSIGSNEPAVRISGIDTDKYIIIGYIGSGLMSGVASVFWSASFATIAVASGTGMELDAIAAVFISGTAAAGGLANVVGCVIGAVMMVVIQSGLNFALAKLNVSINSTYVTYVISGIIVIMAVMADKNRSRSRRRHQKDDPYRAARKRLISYAISLVLLIFLIIASVFFTKNTKAGGTAGKTICFLQKSEGSEFWNAVSEGAQAAGKDTGYQVIARGTEGEDASYLPEQREIMNMMLSENPIGMGVATVADGFSDLLTEAYEQKIPVVTYDSGIFREDLAAINESSSNPIRSTVISDNYKNAAMAAEKIFDEVKQDIAASDTYTVGVIQYTNNQAAADRANGFSDTFKKLAEADQDTAGKCNVLIEVKPPDSSNSYKAALEYLFEKESVLIFCTSGGVINQLFDAIQVADGKYDGVKFGGYDDGKKVREWMNSDSKSPLLGSVSQDPYQMGYTTIRTIVDIAEGKKVQDTIIIPGSWISPEKADQASGNTASEQ